MRQTRCGRTAAPGRAVRPHCRRWPAVGCRGRPGMQALHGAAAQGTGEAGYRRGRVHERQGRVQERQVALQAGPAHEIPSQARTVRNGPPGTAHPAVRRQSESDGPTAIRVRRPDGNPSPTARRQSEFDGPTAIRVRRPDGNPSPRRACTRFQAHVLAGPCHAQCCCSAARRRS